MISFALILMTLPSRVADIRAGRADRAGSGKASTKVADSSLPERCSSVCRGGRRSSETQAAAATSASTVRRDHGDNQGDTRLWQQ